MRTAPVNVVAISEDEPIVWVERNCSRLAAVRGGAAEMCDRPRNFWARKRFMRPATQELDCPSWPHGLDEDEEPPEDCRCFEVEEGWHLECERGEPDAIPVWRVSERPRPLRRRFYRMADKVLWRRRSHRGRKSVLWGGKVERRATRLDRWLGYPGLILLADRWVKPEPIRWLYCDDCRCLTPRRLEGHPICLSDRHGRRGVLRGVVG